MDKAKLLEAIAEKKTEHEKYREKLGVDHLYFEFHEGAATTLEWLEKEINSGKFESDSIPLPNIKPGDKVRHRTNEVRHTGRVRAVSMCGQGALVRWTYSNTDVLNTEEKVSDLEVSHD